MGTVKYTGPVASFHCPTNAEIRSLKVHFSPKQLGEGDPSPENVREIVGWDGVVVHNEADYIPIPEEYQRVEWIKSTGTQYINTNILFNHGIKIFARMGFAAKENSKTLFGVRIDTGATRFLVTYYQGFDFAYWSDTMPFEPEIDHIYDITFDTSVSKKFTYGAGGRLWTTINVTEIYPDLTGYIFAYHRGNDDSVQGMSKSYFQSMHIENASGDVLFNGYACYHKNNNVAGIYDTVTQTFFTNQGTGEFICGPDVGQTTDYEFGVLGKNKFNNATPYKPIEGANYKIQNKEDLLAGLAAGQMIFYGLSHGVSIDEEILYNINNQVNVIMKVAPNATYCFSGSIDSGARTENFIKQFSYFDANFIKLSTGTQTNGVFTVPNDSRIKYVCVYVHNYAQGSSQNPWSISDVLNSLQIELGSTATAYEPYNPNKTVYGGWVDLITGEVAEEGINNHPYRAIILNGTEDWTLVKQDERTTIFKYYYGLGAYSEAYSICSHFKMVLPSYTSLGISNSFVHGMSGNLFIQTDNTLASTIEDFKQYLSTQSQNNTPVTILFQAKGECESYTLVPIQLQTFLGQNNVWSNADYVEVEYDLHETQNILARKQFIIANQPHIVKPAAAPLQNFTTDVPAPLKECKVHFEPVQDLHGYSNPWPAGGGKNVFPYPYVDTTKTDNGITFTDLGDGQIKITGTNDSSGYVYFVLKNDLDFGDTYNSFSYVASSFVNGDYTLNFFGMTSGVGAEYFGNGLVRFRITSGATVNTTVGPTIYKTSDNLSAFVPYENVCPISGWNNIDITIAGNNIIPIDFAPVEGTWKPTGGVISWSVYSMGQFSVPEGKLRWTAPLKGITYIGLMDDIIASGVPTYSVVTATNRTSYTLDNTDKHKYMLMTGSSQLVINNKVMVNIGETTTDYSLPSAITYPIDWTDSAGTVYGGYVDLVSGEVWKTIDKFTFNNNISYSSPSANINQYFTLSTMRFGYNSSLSGVYCDTLPISVNTTNVASILLGVNNRVVYIYNLNAIDSNLTNGTAVRQWLVDNNVSFTYPLATPQLVTTLTPTQLKTLRGTNNIWASNNGGNIEVSFWRH